MATPNTALPSAIPEIPPGARVFMVELARQAHEQAKVIAWGKYQAEIAPSGQVYLGLLVASNPFDAEVPQ